MYAIINESYNADGTGSCEVSDCYSNILTTLEHVKLDIKDIYRNRAELDWARVDVIEVMDEGEAYELAESGDYYDMDTVFHWDTSMID